MKKENRIKKNHEIASIVSKRKKVVNQNYILYYQISENDKLRVAISVSKKYGHAFERNKAKRIVRNIIRKYVHTIANLDIVIVVKPQSKLQPFEKLSDELNFLIKLILRKTQGGKSEVLSGL